MGLERERLAREVDRSLFGWDAQFTRLTSDADFLVKIKGGGVCRSKGEE